MTTLSRSDIKEAGQRALSRISTHWKAFLAAGILMILLGMLSIALPTLATLEIDLLVGWLFTIGGLFRIVALSGKHQVPGFWWSTVSGLLAVVAGTLLIVRPMQGIITLTLLFTVFFVIEGIAYIVASLQFRRPVGRSGWTLFAGVTNLVMAFLIWKGWPTTADWVVGLLAGVNMIFVGLPLIAIALAARRQP